MEQPVLWASVFQESCHEGRLLDGGGACKAAALPKHSWAVKLAEKEETFSPQLCFGCG